MKKLVFLFAMVFAVGMVMTQKTTNLFQSGNNNSADVTQISSSGENFINASQTGDGNSLKTFQLGWENELELYQGGNYNTADLKQFTLDKDEIHGYNDAEVIQKGDHNTASLSQKEVDPNDTDDGGEWVWDPQWWNWFHEEYIPNPEEDRSVNEASATQSGDNNSYTLNQGRQALQPDNESYLVQSGNNNTAILTQLGIQNESEIRQTGDGNNAELLQISADRNNEYNYSESFSWQTGAYNSLEVTQTGEFDEQYAESTQNGNNNSTTITQIGVEEQTVDAYQKGTSDQLEVNQVDDEDQLD